jgi:hypothetical protein
MTNDLIERLLDDSRYASETEREATLRRQAVRREAAAHIEALAERVRELEGALDGVVSRPHWTDEGADDPEMADHVFIDVTMTFGAFKRARQARKDKENG